MKKLILFLMVILPGIAMAEDVVQVLPFSAPVGLTENDYDEEHVMQLYMTNTKSYTAMQLDLYLPDGLSLQLDEQAWDFNPDRFDGITRRGVFTPYHDIDVSKKNDVPGHYLILLYDIDLSVIKGNEGVMIDFYYLTSEDMQPGIYPIVVSGTVLTVDSHNDVKPATSVSYVKIGEPAANRVFDLGSDMYVPSFVENELANENNIVVNGTCKRLVLTDGADYVNTSEFTATTAEYSATVSASLGYKTIVLPFDWTVPSGFEAYEVTGVDSNSELMMSQVAMVGAHEPVILKNAGTAQISASDVSVAASGDALVCGELVGTYQAMEAPTGSYVLQNQGGDVAFYLVGEDIHPAVGTFRAYLKDNTSGARKFTIKPDVATGISNVGNVGCNAEFYNLSGQRIGRSQHGVNIILTNDGVKKCVNR